MAYINNGNEMAKISEALWLAMAKWRQW